MLFDTLCLYLWLIEYVHVQQCQGNPYFFRRRVFIGDDDDDGWSNRQQQGSGPHGSGSGGQQHSETVWRGYKQHNTTKDPSSFMHTLALCDQQTLNRLLSHCLNCHVWNTEQPNSLHCSTTVVAGAVVVDGAAVRGGGTTVVQIACSNNENVVVPGDCCYHGCSTLHIHCWIDRASVDKFGMLFNHSTNSTP